MEKHDTEVLAWEIRGLKERMNNLKDYVKTLHDKYGDAQVSSSEQKFYEFLSILVDKLIQHQDANNGNRFS